MGKKIITKVSGRPNVVTDKVGIINKALTLTYPKVVEGKMRKGMPMVEACKELGITYQTVRNRLKDDPVLMAQVEEVQGYRREIIQEYAENKIEDALTGVLKLRPADQVNTAFRLLEKTHKRYQPKQEVEVKSLNMNFSMTQEEMMAKIEELSRNL